MTVTGCLLRLVKTTLISLPARILAISASVVAVPAKQPTGVQVSIVKRSGGSLSTVSVIGSVTSMPNGTCMMITGFLASAT